MTTTLFWRPNDFKRSVSNELKYAIQKLEENTFIYNKIYTSSDLPYLRGFVAAGIEDAQELIDAINKYGEIVITEDN